MVKDVPALNKYLGEVFGATAKTRAIGSAAGITRKYKSATRW